MVPRGKYNKSPGCRMTSRMGSPMSSSVKFGLDSRGRASSGLLQRHVVQGYLCTYVATSPLAAAAATHSPRLVKPPPLPPFNLQNKCFNVVIVRCKPLCSWRCEVNVAPHTGVEVLLKNGVDVPQPAAVGLWVQYPHRTATLCGRGEELECGFVYLSPHQLVGFTL